MTDNQPNLEPDTSDEDQTLDPAQNNVDPTPSQPEIDNQEIFNAEKILCHPVRNGQTQYLVKWAGYPALEATWE